jgi:hypothetical protein
LTLLPLKKFDLGSNAKTKVSMKSKMHILSNFAFRVTALKASFEIGF